MRPNSNEWMFWFYTHDRHTFTSDSYISLRENICFVQGTKYKCWLVSSFVVGEKDSFMLCVTALMELSTTAQKEKKKEKEKLNLFMLYCTMMILGKTLMFCNCARGDERSIYFFWWKAGCRAVDGPIEANENSIMARRGDCQKQNKNDFLFSCVLDVL